MKLKNGEIFLLLFTAAYILAFSIYYLSVKNYEFIWYIFVLVFFALVIGGTLRKTNFDYVILWGLSICGLLHMSGGGIVINGNVLYALEIFKFFNVGDTYILKFDQIVHAFGFGVTTLVFWHLLKGNLNKNYSRGLMYIIVFAAATGAGALNEIVEFLAAVFIPSTGVGGYYNNSLDLVFNAIGSLIALTYIHISKR